MDFGRCGQSETSSHLLHDCEIYNEKRRDLREILRLKGHNWPSDNQVLVSDEEIFREFTKMCESILTDKEERRKK